MATLNVDLSQVQTYEPIPDGRYTLTLTDYKVVTSKGSKTAGIPMLNATFEVAGDSKYKGRKVWSHMLVAGEYAFTFRSLLSAVMPDVDTTGPFTLDPEELRGVVVEAAVVVDPNAVEDGGNGTPSNNIKRFYAPTGIDGDADSLAAVFS